MLTRSDAVILFINYNNAMQPESYLFIVIKGSKKHELGKIYIEIMPKDNETST